MGKLLRALKLQDKLPDELTGPAKTIGKMEDKLKSAQVKELKLKSSVESAIENLNDLKTQIEPALLDPAESAWLDRYHERVRAELTPLLPADCAGWLCAATAPLCG